MLGLLPFPGTFGEYVCVPEELVHEKPKHLSFEQAAALPLAGLTAFRACFTKGYVRTFIAFLIRL
jgi:zinc-binding alcohol dehydrogenase/oxidoreductase